MRAVEPALVLHGGAGNLPPGETPGPGSRRLEGVRAACEEAWRVLTSGGTAVDAVELAVRLLEDDPEYNAGTGACLNDAGEVELDASIMDGETLSCGAVAAVRDVKNPVTLARRVMEHTPHALLAGEGASAFARSLGIPPWDNARLVTPRQRARWEELRLRRAREAQAAVEVGDGSSSGGGGTVGAVARDVNGHLAAATSTGGMIMKLPGRVGDTPVIGAGTYADDRLAAVSCTGHGERIIQVTLARHAADLVGRRQPAPAAAALAVKYLRDRVNGEGGLVVVPPAGAPGFAYNSEAMSRAWVDGDGRIQAAL